MTPPEQPGQNPQDWQNAQNPQDWQNAQNPQDWQNAQDQQGRQTPYDPYGQPYGQPYSQQPYGQPYGQQPPYGQPPGVPGQGPYDPSYGHYGQPYGYPPRQDGTRTHAIVALVVSIVLSLSCYVSLGGIAAAILSGVALSKVDREPDSSRNLLKWAWISIGINIALIIAGVAFFIIAGTSGAFDTPSPG